MQRRAFLTSAAAIAGCAALRPLAAQARARPLRYADMHSHLGLLGGRASIRDAMVAHGMRLISRKIITDGPVIRRIPGKGVQQIREPAAGELHARFEATLARMKAEHRAESVSEIVDRSTLERAKGSNEPAVVLAAEGGDFLDGDLKRLEAARRQGLVHLQLVHYRVSDIGDVSTERPVHSGLTAFGREVVASCNRLGMLVDVAHCTDAGIAQALDVSTKPLVYSHGQVVSGTPHWTQSVVRARAISSALARRIADKGGVIGVWPLSSQFGSLDAYVSALIDTAGTVGIAHVGVGTDLFGLGGYTVMPDYAQFAQLDDLMSKRGLKSGEIDSLLGANFLRALNEALSV